MRLRYFAQFGMAVLVVGEMDARFLDLFIAQGVNTPSEIMATP